MLLDCLLVMLLDAWVLATMFHHFGSRGPDWWALVISQLLVLPLVLRRRQPWPVFLTLAALAAVQWLSSVPLTADAAVLVSLYSVAAHCSRRHALIAATTVEVGVILASVRFAPTGDGIVASLVFLTGMVAAALFSGITLRTRRQYLAALTERATQLEYERDQQAQLATTAERTRIARELHDVIAHSLSVIITLADGAALSSDRDPAQARKAMLQVAATGRGSMTEMRKLLGVLRDERALAAEFAPQPDLRGIEALVGDVRAAGLPVELTTIGTPPPLGSTEESALYRIVQEGLTNALKHADNPTRVRVELRWSPAGVSVDIIDDGRDPATPPRPARAGEPASPLTRAASGHGLIGMRERAGLSGGTVQAGPTPSGGWAVHAVLPAQSRP